MVNGAKRKQQLRTVYSRDDGFPILITYTWYNNELDHSKSHHRNIFVAFKGLMARNVCVLFFFAASCLHCS